MARRNILTKEDPALYKKCRPVTEFNPRLHQLLDDMKETLSQENGVGLAAPQVGVLRRVVIELVNPEIIESSGEQFGAEGCLSVPEEYGLVRRPMHVKVRAQNRNGETFEVEGEGLTARCFCHEIDHLEGIIFTSKCERMLTKEELESGDFEEE